MKKLVLAAMLYWPVFPAQAQHSVVLQKLTEWDAAAAAPSEDELRGEILTAVERAYGSRICLTAPLIIEAVAPATAERFVFSAVVRQQLRNAWTVTARLPGCDTAPARFMVMQDKANRLRSIRVNRGESYAWDSLIGDTLPMAQIAAVAALKRAKIECPATADSKLGAIRIDKAEPGLGRDVFGVRYAGSWAEIWPLELCGRSVEVLVTFTADGDGGAYTNVPGDRVRLIPR